MRQDGRGASMHACESTQPMARGVGCMAYQSQHRARARRSEIRQDARGACMHACLCTEPMARGVGCLGREARRCAGSAWLYTFVSLTVPPPASLLLAGFGCPTIASL